MAQSSRPYGVHSLNHFALSVPDLQVAEKFYQTFGLDTRADGDTLLLSARNGATVGRIYQGARKKLHHVSFAIEAGDLDQVRARLKTLGVPEERPNTQHFADAIWFRDPEGNLIEVAVNVRTMPTEKTNKGMPATPAGIRSAEGVYNMSKGPGVHPLRLGHCLIFTTDVSRSIKFFHDTLGLGLADRSGDNVAFTYAPHGSDHHILAFARSEHPGLHHASFELADPDHIGMGAANMMAHGYDKGWGFGRHMAGSNFFHYTMDPWGSFVEYFADIDYIPAGTNWQAQDLPPELSLHLWGPPVPDYFLKNAEAAAA